MIVPALLPAFLGLAGNPLWLLTRSTAVVAFVLLTIGTVLGVTATHRGAASPSWPRFAVQNVHRNVTLLALAFTAVHVVTTTVDSYVDIGWVDVVVPFLSGYRTVPVALGTIAIDVLLVVAATGLLRRHIPERTWRIVHVTSYGAWLVVLVHFLLVGTDARIGGWGFWLAVVCSAAVAASVVARLLPARTPRGPVRSLTRRR